MKLTRRNTTILQIVGIIVVVLLTTILMFKPEIIPGLNKDTRSVSGLLRKKDELESLNDQLESTENNLSSIKSELMSIEDDLIKTSAETEKLMKGIENTNFKYDLPSIMVKLEQKAKELNLTFELDYERIQTLTGGEIEIDRTDDPYNEEFEKREDDHDDVIEDELEIEDVYEDEYEEDIGQGGEDEEVEEEMSEDINSPSNSSNRPSVDMSELTSGLPNISGIKITSIPIEVNGSYGNIRLFIEYLDEIDLLEHNIVDLYSFGKEISAIIAFNVYHLAEDDKPENNDYEENYDDDSEYEEERRYEEDVEGGDDY